ncbi:MAG: lipopolysaccharide biosynthesis protein [Bacteroidales bacterium]|nr:lipopolysaccharide biosynthesis protein [Bacteroidales bacterium]
MFKKDSLYKNISILISGTVIAQVIPIAIQPILKRVFTPEDFGVFDIYLKILGILFVVFALKYDMGVVLPKNKIKAQALLIISMLSALVFTLITFLIVLLFNNQILNLLDISSEYSFILYLLPFSTLFFSLYNSINYLLIRDKKFVASSINKVSRRAIEGGVQVGIGMGIGTGLKSYGLFIGDLLGNIAYFVSSYIQSFRGLKIDRRIFRYSFLKSVAIEYSDLPKYNMIPELLNSFFSASLTFIVLAKFSIVDVGYLEATQRLLAIPSAFISVSLGQVILQKVAENVSNKIKIIPELKNLVIIMLLIAIAFTIFILFLGPISFKIFLGDAFEKSGVYAQYLIIYFAVSFLFSAFGQVLIGLKEFKVNAIWQVSKFFLIYSLVFISFDSISTFLLTYSAIGTVVYLIYAVIIFAKARKYDNSL